MQHAFEGKRQKKKIGNMKLTAIPFRLMTVWLVNLLL